MRLFNFRLSTRQAVPLALILAGPGAGAMFGVILTRLGKIATDAPSATLANSTIVPSNGPTPVGSEATPEAVGGL